MLVDDFIPDVGPIETRDKAWRVGKPEAVGNLLPREVVGRRGERDTRHVRETLGDDGQADIFGAEVVAPLRHAMRLVDREQGDFRAAEQCQAARCQQSFRRDIKQVEIARQQPLLDRGRFLIGQRGIQDRCLDAGFQQAGDLVAHQRDQRRDHDAAALAQQRRQLIAERLAAAGRHQHQAIAAIGDMPDDLFLRAAKARQAEHGIQDGERVGSDAGPALARRGNVGSGHAASIWARA